MLCRNTSIFPGYEKLAPFHHPCRQTWAVSLEAVFCQWGDRCLHAIPSRSHHSYNHDWGLRMSWSSRNCALTMPGDAPSQ